MNKDEIVKKKIKLISRYFFGILKDVIILYILLFWENLSLVILIQNNFLGVVYKDFNCNNWTNYISNVSPEVKKSCKIYDSNNYISNNDKFYFEKDNISINYPNLWIYNDIFSKREYYLNFKKEFDKNHYCKEFLETEKLVHHGFSEYQNFKPIKNKNYDEEKKRLKHFYYDIYKERDREKEFEKYDKKIQKYEDITVNPIAEKELNKILITKLKMFIKNKTEVLRCIPNNYIINNSVIVNRVGTSLGYSKCSYKHESSKIYIKGENSTWQVTYNYGFKLPNIDGEYIINKLILYPLLYVFSYIAVFYKIFILLTGIESKDLIEIIKNYFLNKFYKKNKVDYSEKRFEFVQNLDLKKYKRKIKFTELLTKLLCGFLFYYFDVINLYICDLNNGKLECYINKITLNTYVRYSNLRSEECYNYDLFESWGSLYFLNIFINMFFTSLFLGMITILLGVSTHPVIGHFSGILIYGFCYCSKHYHCCINALYILTPFVILIFSSLILILFDIGSIFMFFIELISGNWDVLNIKLPNFKGLNLDLGFMYNKNLIFLIKVTVYLILIIIDIYYTFKNYNIKNLITKKKNKEKELELTQL